MAGKKLENWLKVSEITEKLHLSERAILEERENSIHTISSQVLGMR
jgi:hypothetical protein